MFRAKSRPIRAIWLYILQDDALDQEEERPLKIVMTAYADAHNLDVCGPLEVFSQAARYIRNVSPNRSLPYQIEVASNFVGPVEMCSGLSVVATRDFNDQTPVDTLLVAGGLGYRDAASDPELIAFVQVMAGRARRVASICNGAFILAAAGLLRDREVTTHWGYFEELESFEPRCRVNRDAIFVKDGPIYTSAGVTAGMDLALALVEEDFGSGIALGAAQELVMYVRRPGGQTQFSSQIEAELRDDRLGSLALWLLNNLRRRISVDDMARQTGMSRRHFVRRFHEKMGIPPYLYLTDLRVECAKRHFEKGSRNFKAIARESGFESSQHMRRAFLRKLGTTPTRYLAELGASRGLTHRLNPAQNGAAAVAV